MRVVSYIVAALLLLTAVFGIGFRVGQLATVPELVTTIDTIVMTDTIVIHEGADTVIRTVDRPYLVAMHDTTTVTDSIWVMLPYEHHYYEQPDTLQLWYSGVDARIDSAIVYRHQRTIIEQHLIKEPERRNIVGIQVGTLDASAMYMRDVGPLYLGISAGATWQGAPTARASIAIRF